MKRRARGSAYRCGGPPAKVQNPDAHGPGPPQRPHPPLGAADADAFDFAPAPSAPTANTLSALAVLVDPHDGHFTLVAPPSSALLIVRCN